jgi:hypothetical protein
MIRKDYVFNSATRTITFTNSVDIVKIGAIFNVTAGINIYSSGDPSTTGSISGQVLTLVYNTTSMSNSDVLQIFYSGDGDNANLLTYTISSVAISSAIDTTGYPEIIAQIFGGFSGILYVETSSNGSDWDISYVFNRNEPGLYDSIVEEGTFSVYRAGQYIRINVKQLTSSGSIILTGRTGMSLSPVDSLALAMNSTNGVPLQVQLPQNLKQDITGALIGSDAATLYTIVSTVANQVWIIDTTGYNSIIIHQTTTGTITPNASNDGVNWLGIQGYVSTAVSTPATSASAAGVYMFPVNGKFIRLQSTFAGVNAFVYLRQAPFIQTNQNLGSIAGTAPVTAGQNGMLAVGGNIAPGTTPTANPVLIAGVDTNTTPLTRRLLTDTTGKLLTTPTALGPDGLTRSQTVHAGQLGTYIQVADTTSFEGSNALEFQMQILLELKILNQQISELPLLLNNGINAVTDPDVYRNDPQGFKI